MTWAACYGHQMMVFLTQGDNKNMYWLLVGKFEGKKTRWKT